MAAPDDPPPETPAHPDGSPPYAEPRSPGQR